MHGLVNEAFQGFVRMLIGLIRALEKRFDRVLEVLDIKCPIQENMKVFKTSW